MREIIHRHQNSTSYIALLDDKTVVCNIGLTIYGSIQTIEEFIKSLQELYQSNFEHSKASMIKAIDKNEKDQKRLNQLNEIRENLYKESIESRVKNVIHEHKIYDSYIALLDDKTVIYIIGPNIRNENGSKSSAEDVIDMLQEEYRLDFKMSQYELNRKFDENEADIKRLNQLKEIKEIVCK